MKHIKAEMFPEFDFLIYAFAIYILLGIVVAITGRKKHLYIYLALFVAGGIAALIDFYQWGYQYGHDLDPKAAIQVPGLSYQPPLIGHKQLLNFDAFSYPDIGGWIVIGVVVLFMIIAFFEWRRERKNIDTVPKTYRSQVSSLNVGLLLSLFLFSCTPQSEKIQLGKDSCAECKMTISDPRFGGEIVTKKGKVYKFDDVHCIAHFMKRRGVGMSDIYQTLFVDFNKPGSFVSVRSAEFVISSQLKSPMNGNAAAFASKSTADSKSAELEGSKTTNWATLYNILVK